MKITEYIKSSFVSILCQWALILIINGVLLASTNLEKSTGDILYLDLLMLLIFLAFFTYGFLREKRKYGNLRKCLDSNSSVDYYLPEDDSYYSELVRDIVSQKTSENLELVNVYKNELDELNNYITRWVHEIKLPISVAELMLENSYDSDIEFSRKFKAELERIKFLVNQVLYAGRASHYQEDHTATQFSLKKAVGEAIKINAYFLMAKNIEIVTGNLDFAVTTDEKWLVYILEQILNNASKYVQQDGKVEIFAQETHKTVVLHIKDSGMGIPPSDISRIFDKGFTGKNGRKTSKSTGMGLYYSKKISARLGIGLTANSIEGEYTEFQLSISKFSDYLNVTKI
ncbi:integral membrane sensor signal transduction histidine kinase [Ruminiclostridium papyrosolvens DSM 2782]|uniref:histidine kinase n=1 Tax=Ruminiclostridium papyrosolvens DSM 2782 TaxID=588581 RepID=F1TFN6_9FIRM|nr:sensor histidine kinase [Ruminiclostridium papyrosolvens]EGD46768.1 integral membrane sensor signal transduction histidine kinase [Ruminiclostridium papyrosolvens DSM 2782]WES34891.1 sensor histidine kinase [Ruminiclostridium papyrosolvens DSM 2782]